jgi:hypothetical protein
VLVLLPSPHSMSCEVYTTNIERKHHHKRDIANGRGYPEVITGENMLT